MPRLLQKNLIHTERGPWVATDCHKMSSINHVHTETEMVKVKEHSELLSAQIELDVWNQRMSVTLSQPRRPLRD